MTSAPKSERMTAAPGPAMKLARSTTLRPEKILSAALAVTFDCCCAVSRVTRARPYCSPSLEVGGTLFQEGGGTLALVFGARADRKHRSLQQQPRRQTRLHSLVHRFQRKADGDRRVVENL